MDGTYHLAIGQRSYSSWSLRPWLLLERFHLPYRTTHCALYSPDFAQSLAPFAPAKTVPALITPEGVVIGESLAIAEELATRHPDLGLWPQDPKARAAARTVSAEMHSGFVVMRQNCPFNMRFIWQGFEPSEAVLADLERLETVWAWARSQHSAAGPWLFGAYSIADAFYAPMAARLTCYGLKLSPAARDYVSAHLADPALRRWRALGLASEAELSQYEKHLPRAPWPTQSKRPAVARESGPSVNALCPYSGKPVAWFLDYDGQTYGFCNQICRDKTLIDPEAWPAFMDLVAKHQSAAAGA